MAPSPTPRRTARHRRVPRPGDGAHRRAGGEEAAAHRTARGVPHGADHAHGDTRPPARGRPRRRWTMRPRPLAAPQALGRRVARRGAGALGGGAPPSSLTAFRGGATPDKSRDDFWDGDIPWVSPKDMWMRSLIGDSEDHVTHEALSGSSIALLPTESVLVVVRGMTSSGSGPLIPSGRHDRTRPAGRSTRT